MRLAACAISALTFAGPVLADVSYEPWRTGNYGGDDSRTGAITCTTDHPLGSCMQVGCGPGDTLILSFTELGFVRDAQSAPAGPAATTVVIKFPSGRAFKMQAQRVAVAGKAYNEVVVRNWQSPEMLEDIAALGKGSDKARIKVSLPDGRTTTFTSKTMNFAVGQAPRLCAR